MKQLHKNLDNKIIYDRDYNQFMHYDADLVVIRSKSKGWEAAGIVSKITKKRIWMYKNFSFINYFQDPVFRNRNISSKSYKLDENIIIQNLDQPSFATHMGFGHWTNHKYLQAGDLVIFDNFNNYTVGFVHSTNPDLKDPVVLAYPPKTPDDIQNRLDFAFTNPKDFIPDGFVEMLEHKEKATYTMEMKLQNPTKMHTFSSSISDHVSYDCKRVKHAWRFDSIEEKYTRLTNRRGEEED